VSSWGGVRGSDHLSVVPKAGANPWAVGGQCWHVVCNPGVGRKGNISSAVQPEEQY